MTTSLDLAELYRDLHAHPELAFQEHRTAGAAAQHMRTLGLDVIEGIGGTGVAAVCSNGEGPTVWLRADMDGLPVEELTGLDYASTTTGVGADGTETPVMHACGHDMHVTWLIGAMRRLVLTRESWSGTVVAVFQPAEESIAGATAMIEDSLLERVPLPNVVLGQHVAPFPAGVVSLTSGTAMAGSDDIAVVLHGRGGHGSRPEATIDPVLAAASTVVGLQSIVSREVTPGTLAVVTVGTIHAGSASNIIPAEARLGVNVRSLDAKTRDLLVGSIDRIVRAEAQAAGMTTEPEINVLVSAPATINDATATQVVRDAFAAEWGEASVIDYGAVSGSEDVGVLASAASAPLVFWFTGGSDPVLFGAAAAAGRLEQDIASNHSPYFAPVLEPTLERGVAALVVAALAFLD
ncbi:amidohydrolase [Agreia sp. COWG]|uniref:amidohydrolase n=1 Tax=Agreia sp. COWG TaxID=2773266 RepID=UPI001925C944|nr:amidohydrolase [Agreia sp. COWG]